MSSSNINNRSNHSIDMSRSEADNSLYLSMPSSSSVKTDGDEGSFKLRVLRHQQLHATIALQRYARGYLTRHRIWSYGGVFFVYCVLRIQCAWRRYLALKRVREVWQKKVDRCVHRIHSLFYFWKSRRLRKIIRLTYLKGVITKFQANVRRKLMRRRYLILLFIHKTKNSTKIQSIVRLLLAKNFTARKNQCIEDILQTFAPFTTTLAMEQMRNDIGYIITHKTIEISRMIPKLQESVYSFAYSIVYDLSINNQMMQALAKSHYLNLCFQKIQYNLLTYLRQNKNQLNKLLYQTVAPVSSSNLNSNGGNSAPTTSLITQIQHYHHFQFIVQFINYLVRMNLWTKYNKTRQTHFLFLEQSLGILSCQYTVMSYNYPPPSPAPITHRSEATEPTTATGATPTGSSIISPSLYSPTLNPYSLMSLLMFPKQLLNSRQSVSAPVNASFSANSERSLSSSSMASASPRSATFPPSPDMYHAPKDSSSADLLRMSSKSFSLRGSSPAPGAFLQPVMTLAGSVMSQQSQWQWHGYSLNELVQTMFLISSWHSTSLIKLFDAIMFKVDVLFYLLSFPNLFEYLTSSTKKMLEEFYSAFIEFPEDHRENAITNNHLYYSDTPDSSDTSLVVHHGLPFYRITARPITAAPTLTAEEEEIQNIDLNQVHDIRKFREIQRKRKEKKVVKKVKQIAKSPRHRTLHRIWKLLEKAREIVIPGSLDSYELSYRMDLFNSLFQTVHDGYVIRDMLKEFIMVLDAQNNSILPTSNTETDESENNHQNQQNQQKKMKMHQLKNQNKGTSFTVQIHIKVVISGAMIFVIGAIPPPPARESRSQAENTGEEENQSKTKGKSQTGNNANQRHVQSFLYEKIPVFPWPIHPMILFPHEINQVANNHKIFSINQFSILGQQSEESHSKSRHRISRRLSSNQWLDYERFVDYVLSEMSLTFTNNQAAMSTMNSNPVANSTNGGNLTPQQTFISTDSEPLLSFYLPEIHHKRKLLLDNNVMKYSVIMIQRMFRGFLGRKRFALIRINYLIMKRKRYLSYKVFYRLKAMHHRHILAAIQIQRVVKGRLLRQEIKRWHFFILKIQCRFRMHQAKKRLAEEKKRMFDGPQVVLMNRGGKVIEIQSQLIQLFIYRCANHYKFVGWQAISNRQYLGYVYQKELKQILNHYNQDVIASLNYDSQSTYSKQLQIQIWQHEKMIGFFYRYLNLLPKQLNVTTQFSNERREETSYYLAVCYQRGSVVRLDTDPSNSSALVPANGGRSPSKWNEDEELQKTWRHNYQNLYRSNSLTQNPTEIKRITLEQVLLPPITEQNRLQTEIPRDFTQHPIIDTVKKFQIFKEFNNQRARKKPAQQQQQRKKSIKPKTPENKPK